MTPLDSWLATATRGLSTESAIRVRSEIRDHYQSSYEAAAEHGNPPEVAERLAVEALGNAKVASRQYRHVLLTANEARFISLHSRAFASAGTSALFLIASILLYVPVLVFGMWAQHGLTLVALLLFWAQPVVWNAPLENRFFWYSRWFVLIPDAALAVLRGVRPFWTSVGMLLILAYLDYRMMSLLRKLPDGRWPFRLRRR